jgi:hypothetical protein
MNTQTIAQIVFDAIAATALLVQAMVVLAAYIAVRKAMKNTSADLQELRTSVIPTLTRLKEILEKVAPKVESISTDLADITQTAKEQTARISFTTDEILARVHRQTIRVDNMMTNVVDGVEHAGNVVSDSVSRPVRQVTAVLASVKAFLSVLARGRGYERPVEVVTDQDMFV